jgi:hypothetical protein
MSAETKPCMLVAMVAMSSWVRVLAAFDSLQGVGTQSREVPCDGTIAVGAACMHTWRLGSPSVLMV